MKDLIRSSIDTFITPVDYELEEKAKVANFFTAGLPLPHPAEADTFTRQSQTPGHYQEALENAHILLVGAGGLNSWTALGLLRAGVRHITIVDDDTVDRTNLPRQLYYGSDLGKGKGAALAQNLIPHALSRTQIVGLNYRLEDAIESFPLSYNLMVVGVDRNDCRLHSTRLARENNIPAVFTMLSTDGMRVNCFLQGSDRNDPCLWCALPNLRPDSIMPCAAAIITSCLLASAFTLYFVFRALMGWPVDVQPFNWREEDLQGLNPSRIGHVLPRKDCMVCGNDTLG
jgi:molybdopterin/thiamine biosynthesis adenylyltransferase